MLIRLGNSGLKRLRYHNAHLPEQSFAYEQAAAHAVPSDAPKLQDRPPRLLARPLPIRAMALLPDHPPNWISWRGVRRRVRRADGPERVFGEWWKRDAELVAVRDYFRIEDDAGERFWIFRAGDGEDVATGSHRWFLHGVFG